MKIMATGSRSMITSPNALDIYKNLEQYILRHHEKYGDELLLISGMAEGWDEAMALVGLRNNIPYDVYVPSRGYGEYYWAKHSLLKRDRYDRFSMLCGGARDVITVCTTLYKDGLHANFWRNLAMVEACDAAVVYESGSPGTRHAVNALIKANKPYFRAPFNEDTPLF